MSSKAKAVGLLVLVSLLLAAVGGAYLFYQYKTKQLVVELLGYFLPIAEVSVNQIEVDFSGKVQLDRIQVAPRGFKDTLSIDRVDVITQGPWALLTSGDWFKRTLPKNLNLQLTGIIFSLNSDFISAGQHPEKTGKSRSIWGLACSNERGQEGDFIALAKRLSMAKLAFDARIEINSDNSQKLLKSTITFDSAGLVRGLFEFSLSSKVPLNFQNSAVLRQINISNMLLNVTDTGFNIKRLKYCAKQEGISESLYPDYLRASINLKMLNNDGEGAEDLDQSIMTFFKPRTNVVLGLTAKEPVYLPTIFDPRFDIFKAQDLNLLVSGNRISTRYLTLLRGQLIAEAPVQIEIEAEKEMLLAGIKKQVRKNLKQPIGPIFRKVAVDELEQFEGKEVRLQTLLGKELDGVLLKVENKKIIMRRRVEQGIVTYPVMKKSIASIKVYL